MRVPKVIMFTLRIE